MKPKEAIHSANLHASTTHAQAKADALESVESQLKEIVAKADELRKRRASLKAKLESDLLKLAQKSAKKKAIFRIGDIIEYTDDLPPILVTRIECYESGDPTYRGLEVRNGKITRKVRSTSGWGYQEAHVYSDGKEYPSSWKKVGDCEALRMVVPNNSAIRKAKGPL